MGTAITNETTYRAVLGAILANRRTELGLKQEDVARAAGLSTPTWSRIEKGENPLTTEQLRRVASVLRVTPSALIKLEEEAVQELRDKGVDVRDELSIDATMAASPTTAENKTAQHISRAAVGSISGAIAGAGAFAGAEAGVAIGFAVPVVGPILGALIGGLAAYNMWKKREAEEDEKREKVGGKCPPPKA